MIDSVTVMPSYSRMTAPVESTTRRPVHSRVQTPWGVWSTGRQTNSATTNLATRVGQCLKLCILHFVHVFC